MEEQNDTSGFYKNDNGSLLYAPNYVLHRDYELRREQHDSYEYPVEGWYWFESEAEARTLLGLPPKDEGEETGEANPDRP